jgi:hypothetical protein
MIKNIMMTLMKKWNWNTLGNNEEIVVDEVESIIVVDEAIVVANNDLNEEELQTYDKFGVQKTIKHSSIYGTTSEILQFTIDLQPHITTKNKKKHRIHPHMFFCLI